MNLVLLSLFVLFASLPSLAQDSSLEDLSLEELMDVKVKVTTQTEKSIREAPGIVTVITAEQIKNIGARDLRDILVSVPGITIGHDIIGNLSIIMRGMWAQEGRLLLLIDGLEMNERSYGSLQLGNHYPAEHIQRVEIIRGPGSAIYGGFAELGVINVITKSGEDLKGVALSSSYSATSKDFSRQINNFMFGHSKDNLSLSVKGMHNKSNFTDRSFTDENGASADLGNGNTATAGEFLNLQTKYKNLYANYIRDNYRTHNLVLWGDLENVPGGGVRSNPVRQDYLTDAYQLGFQGDVSERINLNVYYQNKVQHPFYQPEPENDQEFMNSWRRKVERNVAGLRAMIKLGERADLSVGSEYSKDRSMVLNQNNYEGNPDVFGDGTRDMELTNTALFSQFNINSDLGNLTAGLRHDAPSDYDNTLVPRLGLTKIFGKAHLKALYAQAFRAPVIENVSLNDEIKPEITTTSEIEFGYLFNKQLSWNANLFHTKVKDIMVYSFNAVTGDETYTNYPNVTTMGFETELIYKTERHDVKFNYSTYRVSTIDAEPFESGLENAATIGAPEHKFYLSDAIKVTENFRLTPSLVYLNNIYGYKWDGGVFEERKLENQLIVNMFGNYKNLFFKGFEVGLGINNLLNSNVYYVQPYVKEGDYRSGPYPGQSRDYIARIGYSMEY